MTQSAISHALARLRRILGDPLFVQSGQGLKPTNIALSLKEPAQDILDRLKQLTHQRPFAPKTETLQFTIAANDMLRDLIFTRLVHQARQGGIDLSLVLRPSGVPSVDLLRSARRDMIVTPLPPDAPDPVQQNLFSGDMMCFFDGATNSTPASLQAYQAADHIMVQFALGGWSHEVIKGADVPSVPQARTTLSNFAGLTSFVRGTRMLATQLEDMHLCSLQDSSIAPLPSETDPVYVFTVWHGRSNSDPAHHWLREHVLEIELDIGKQRRTSQAVCAA